MLNLNEIAERVGRVVEAKLRIDPDRITQLASFDADLAATSLDMVETIMSLEDEFGVEISDRDAESLKTVGDVVSLIGSKVL
jgi:acyl carrier protein